MTRTASIVICGRLAALIMSPACSDDHTSIGPTGYIGIAGSATILSISDAPQTDTRCINDPVAVMFFFVPDDFTAADSYI